MQSDKRLQPDLLSGNASRLQMALKAARMVAWELDVATGRIQYSGDLSSILATIPA